MALSTTIDPARLQRAVAVAEDAVRNGPYPSAVIAVANAETTLLTHIVSHPERAPVREDGIFLLASITKPIVATAIMRLVEEGRLLLTDPVVKYIPEFGPFGKQLGLNAARQARHNRYDCEPYGLCDIAIAPNR